jgi:hypothetical protein
MTNHISDTEAELALGSIEQRRRQVIAEIDMPRWYWAGMALGWIALGVLADLGNPWLTTAATLVFGAVHASVSQHVLSGRHRSTRLSVRADVVSRHVPALVIGFLIVMVLLTVVIALAIAADGAEHAATIASVIVAVAVFFGGPTLMAAVRRRAEHGALG